MLGGCSDINTEASISMSSSSSESCISAHESDFSAGLEHLEINGVVLPLEFWVDRSVGVEFPFELPLASPLQKTTVFAVIFG